MMMRTPSALAVRAHADVAQLDPRRLVQPPHAREEVLHIALDLLVVLRQALVPVVKPDRVVRFREVSVDQTHEPPLGKLLIVPLLHLRGRAEPRPPLLPADR